MIQPLFIFSDWGILILRLVLALILIIHGLPKIKNLKTTAQGFKEIGFKPAKFWAFIAAVAEFFGGLMLLVGFLTQLVALITAIGFLVILLKLKAKQKFHNSELEFLILAAALALLTLGGGTISLDQYWLIYLY